MVKEKKLSRRRCFDYKPIAKRAGDQDNYKVESQKDSCKQESKVTDGNDFSTSNEQKNDQESK